MTLTLEQIRQITVGALDVFEENGVIFFRKCTPAQIEAWAAIADILGFGAQTTTGVRLDFYTNSAEVSFTIGAAGQYEVYIDGVLSIRYDEDLSNPDKKISLDGAEHRVTLILPSHRIGALKTLALEDGADFRRPTYGCKILFLGDSITQGWQSDYDSLSWTYHVTRAFDADSLIQGIGGAIFAVETLEEHMDFDPDIVLIAYGTNDWGVFQSLEMLEERCDRFLERIAAQYGGKKVFCITPIWRADSAEQKPMGSFAACREAIRTKIEQHGLIHIDGMSLTPHLDDFFTDGLHPNATGFGIYAQNVIAQMQKHL